MDPLWARPGWRFAVLWEPHISHFNGGQDNFVSQNITVSMNLVSNSSWKAYVLSVLSVHLPEKMMVGPSREGWEISTYVLARLLQNPSSFWLTSSLLNEFWARELAHVWKLSKNAEHLVSYGVAFLSLLVIYSWLIVVWISLFLGGCLSLLPPRILYPGNCFIAACRPDSQLLLISWHSLQ